MAEKPTYQELEQRIKELEKSESELRRTETAWKKKEVYLRTLILTLPDLVWMKDPDGKYLFCNFWFERFFGAKEEDIIGRSDYEFVDREVADFFRKNDMEAMAKGGPSKNEEEVIVAADGRRKLLETTKTPIYDDDGTLIGVLGMGRDITKQREAEKEHLDNLEFFENLDKVNRAVQSTNDLDRMMSAVLDIVLSIFNCDRAYLLYACDPDDQFWTVPMECTVPEYPGAYKVGGPLPMTPDLQQMHRTLLNTQGPVQFQLGREINPEKEPWKQFKIKSILAGALYPKIGKPWHFGIHQCSHARVWTPQEEKTFQEIGHRLTDGLTSLLIYQDLQKNEESYRTILGSAPYSIVITRLSDGVILHVNETFTRRLGICPEDVIGHTALSLNIYDDPSHRKHLMDILEREGEVSNEYVVFIAGDGRRLESLVSMNPISFKGENCIVSMTVDISELKRTQRALEESETRFRAIFESAADPIFLNDIQTGQFINVNFAACHHLGYDKDELLKMSFAEIKGAGAFDPIAHFKKHRGQDESLFFESTHRRKDGSIAAVEVSCQPMMHQKKIILLSIIRDVTQRKQTEVELARYRQKLEKMVNERTFQLKETQSELVKKEKMAVLGQLTATVSHEMRNPLGVIRSSNFFLQRKIKDRDEKVDKHFKRIDEQVSLCEAIVADLLAYTRGHDINVVKKNISSWLPPVIEQLEEQKNIAVKLKVEPDLPEVPHDEEKLRRVLLNLLINAAQAVDAKAETLQESGGEYSPQVRLKIYPEAEGIALVVSDNGIGMDAETKAHAFEPLFTTRSRGTGLGLSIVKKIVEDHGGNLTLESRQGEGTRIKLWLPFAGPKKSADKPDT